MSTLLIGESERRLYPLDPGKIDYVESDGNYVSIRSGSAAYIGRDSLQRLSGELEPLGFVRIGRESSRRDSARTAPRLVVEPPLAALKPRFALPPPLTIRFIPHFPIPSTAPTGFRE